MIQIGLFPSQYLRGSRFRPQRIHRVQEVVVSKGLGRGGSVLRIPHQTPCNEVAQCHGPLRCLQNGVHRMGCHLGKRKPQLSSQSSSLAPIAPADPTASFVVPVARAAHNFTYPPNLVNLVTTRKQRLQRRDFDSHGTDCPDIHRSRVFSSAQEHFWSSIPARRDICRIWKL